MKKETGFDEFSEIARAGIRFSDRNLVQPEPPAKDERVLPLNQGFRSGPFRPLPKMLSPEQLQEELERQREYYRPFMRDLAPEIESRRESFRLSDFSWRVETEDDRRDFGRVLRGEGLWESVKVPHYGEPLGKASTYYRTSFELSREQLSRGALFICFKAVDYKAHVFLNGSYIGSHEGFFAPFEFDFTSHSHEGNNILLVKVENDSPCGHGGDKIYAATGLGYDDPERGWHHCPAGMGIYQTVSVELRPRIHIQSLFIRPLIHENRAEAWIEIFNCDSIEKQCVLEMAVYGQNFDEEVFSNLRYLPSSRIEVGVGDTLSESKLKKSDQLGREISVGMKHGINYLVVPFAMNDFRLWELREPWLYQFQVKLLDENDDIIDTGKSGFGMRSFNMDTEGHPKGRFYLNDRQIRLRGANTMGHEQQCVFKEDWDQLRDDLLLAKICNMNFLRITQRPVQTEVYEYCDKLGLMTQTDLPLFGVLRRNQFCEAVKQAAEMERLIRSHPCNVIISYINEPFPNAGNEPHRHLSRNELTAFFQAADLAVLLHNPDRVIKPIDGDYDPPGPGFPDNHCYPAWYNGHGIDIGKLHKGYWMFVKPGWNYGCGEFGAEGLDPVDVMRKYYPDEWLPGNANEEEDWSPNSIIKCQTGRFHYLYFDTQNNLDDWVRESQKHQAWGTRIMTEAFRRDSRMNSFAIHLLIDAFPSGWMKTIMDVERRPKPAFFAYREALTPLMVNARTDRFKFFEGERISVEAWICNDLNHGSPNATLAYFVESNGKVLSSGKTVARIPVCSSLFQGYISFDAPIVENRTALTVRIGILDEDRRVLHDTAIELEVFPQPGPLLRDGEVRPMGDEGGKAFGLVRDLGLDRPAGSEDRDCDVIILDDFDDFLRRRAEIAKAVEGGATLILLELPEGSYEIWDSVVVVKACGMSPVHFVSRKTDHPAVEGFEPDDFKWWYDPEVEYVTPLLETTFTADGFSPILTTGNIGPDGEWAPAFAVAERQIGGQGRVIVSQIKLSNRVLHNPVARLFAKSLLAPIGEESEVIRTGD